MLSLQLINKVMKTITKQLSDLDIVDSLGNSIHSIDSRQSPDVLSPVARCDRSGEDAQEMIG